MSQDSHQAPRQPPRFVPTLTDMVRSSEPAPAAESKLALPAEMPTAFAELLKDWPALGEPVAQPVTQPASVSISVENFEQSEGPSEAPSNKPGHKERVALRAEALLMQRLPALLAGLVSQAVRDAMAEVEAGDRNKPRVDPSI